MITLISSVGNFPPTFLTHDVPLLVPLDSVMKKNEVNNGKDVSPRAANERTNGT